MYIATIHFYDQYHSTTGEIQYIYFDNLIAAKRIIEIISKCPEIEYINLGKD